jgi:hypothetical protein
MAVHRAPSASDISPRIGYYYGAYQVLPLNEFTQFLSNLHHIITSVQITTLLQEQRFVSPQGRNQRARYPGISRRQLLIREFTASYNTLVGISY